jgi:hypothetical protein
MKRFDHDRPFPRSIESLANLALRELPADGFAIYQLDPGSAEPVLKACGGLQATKSGEAEGFGVASFPLTIDDDVAGLLSFVFRNGTISAPARLLVEKIAGAIESLWRFSLIPARYARIALRIGELEVELADAKIADRAAGMLQNAGSSGNPIDAIAHHVESVLRPSGFDNALVETEGRFAQQLAERQLTSRAKAVLQSRYGISEEQAHVHLRIVSRASRKKLRDVAQALIEDPVLYVSHAKDSQYG